jgi:hypothetical protein
MRNLKLALGALARTSFVTAVAALSLGLGIGANSAIYLIFYRMMRQELPDSGADRLVNFSAPGPKDGGVNLTSSPTASRASLHRYYATFLAARLSPF